MPITPDAFNQRFPIMHFDPEQAAALVAVLGQKTLRAHEPLITQGQFSDTLYLLWSGRLAITITADGVRLVLGELEPGRWVGEFGFIDPSQAAADVSATTDAEVLVLTQDGMQVLYQQSPDTASALLQALSLELAERLRATSRHSLERKDDDTYTLRQPQDEEPVGWLSRLGRRLMGLTGE